MTNKGAGNISRTVYTVLVFVFVLTGCVQIQTSSPEKRRFILDVNRPEEEPARDSGAILLVNPLRVPSRYEGKGFKYLKKDLLFEDDFYNEFFTRPGVMLAEEVKQWLSRSGLFARVLGGTGPMLPTHILEGMVEAIHGDYRSRPAQAVLEIEFVLISGTGSGSEIVFKNTYRRQAQVPDGDPQDLVDAWNRELFEILESLEEDLRQVLSRN